MFKLGVENIPDSLTHLLAQRSVALLTNHTGKDQTGRRTVDVLCQKGITIKAILVPEHGLDGSVIAGKEVSDGIDATTQIPIISLYGKGEGKKINSAIFDAIEILIVDIQDIGMRHYTYISTLVKLMEAAAQHETAMVILDRPNPLGGIMEGPLVDEGLLSYISIAAIPLRHGMTIGELALYFNSYHLAQPVRLHVVAMEHYDRTKGLPGTVAHMFSPNILTKNSCYGYSFLGLLGEIRPFDVALGTEKSFQCIMLPENVSCSQHVWYELHQLLKTMGIQSSPHRYFSIRKKKFCNGLHLHCNAIPAVQTFKLFMAIVTFFKQAGVELAFSQDFDKAIGTSRARNYIEGKDTQRCFNEHINNNVKKFMQQSTSLFLYLPHPTIKLL